MHLLHGVQHISVFILPISWVCEMLTIYFLQQSTYSIGIDHVTQAAARRPAHSCCAGSGSTNHSSADRMSGQFLFYHENEAKYNDKSRDDHDDEPPCWNALADNAIVMMKASIDTVSE